MKRTSSFRSLRSVGAALVSVSLFFSLGVLRAASVPAPIGTGGAVASADPLATAVGLDTLRAGGNAVDAAVATAIALSVVYPEAGNLGGGGFAVVRMKGEIYALDFREIAPSAARRDMYLDKGGKLVPNASLVGPLASGVPGSPSGLFELHKRFGRLPWTRVVAPARKLAAEGFRVSRYLHDVLGRDDNKPLLAKFEESSKVWLPGGEPVAVGSVLRLPALAATLDRYARQGPAGITEGPIAAAIEAASRKHGGILTRADLAAYKPVWRTPLTFEAFGWRVAAMPLPSSGGVILGQTVGILERQKWNELPRFGADRVHILTEALRRSFADRFQLGDPSTTHATEAQLLDPLWLDQRSASIDRQHATSSPSVQPWGAGKAIPAAQGSESADTTHLSTVDSEGNLVALTTTLNGLFGCGLWVEKAGLFLNNEMDDFAALPGQPNLFGLIQGEANAVAPGKRMLSSMSPLLAWKGDEAYALGGRGGSRIPTQVLQVLLNLIVDGDRLQAALDRPRLHHQWLPDLLEVEADALSPETEAELVRRGQTIGIAKATCKVHAVHRLADGRVEAASDPRASGVGGVVVPDP